MKYENIEYGLFNKKINRFIAEVYINGSIEQVHIKNTGRLIEILQPETKVILEVSTNPNRKTKYSLITAIKNDKLVNIDSQVANIIVFDALKQGKIEEIGVANLLRREVKFGESRFDIYYEKDNIKGFIEVKGVTLESNGVAMFPDAPTSRGTKHILELIKAKEEGYNASILFVIQMKGCHVFSPFKDMDKVFTDALIKARRQGVNILVYDSIVKEDEIILNNKIPLKL